MRVVIELLLAEASTMTAAEMCEIREILDNEEFHRMVTGLRPKQTLSEMIANR